MSKHRERPPLRIRPRPSRLLAAFQFVTHGAALGVVCALPVLWYWRVGTVAMVLSGLIYALGVQVLYFVPWAVREATWQSDGTWILNLVSGARIESLPLQSAYVTRILLVLNFRCGRWHSRSLVLVPDALDADLLRRLRVRLRLSGAGDGSATDTLV